ncbi:MAG: hypothetical protein HN348_21080, partial [Proteobacteria bacterium]|nr:hypothetical protein [Pseudomonadota bacterium]
MVRRLGKWIKRRVGLGFNDLTDRAAVGLQVDLDEEVSVTISGGIPVQTRFSQDLSVKVKKDLHTVAAIDQILEIPIDETLRVPLELNLHVPLDTNVHIKDVLNIETTVHIDTKVTAMNVAPIPIKATVPLSLEIPLDQKVHIQGELDVPIHRELLVHIQHPIRVKLTKELPVVGMLDEELPVEVDVELKEVVHISH